MGRRAKFYGYDLPKPIYEACEKSIKAYPYLVNVEKNLNAVSGFRKNFADKVIDRVALSQHIREINDAFEEIPESYREAVKYYLFTTDTNDLKQFKVQTEFGRDYQETAIWVRKLVYFYAKQVGYPVSSKNTEHKVDIDDEGNLDFW